uniref:Glycosyltransferase, family 2 n=1 Tax=uncultured Poseidoniia archaeon TaxID=1697135 RepID=A0A1B1TF90_9ARCH|nr:Glycosyltransferase, family 2 [uncultured Candidatus Thalassoarchaea sp.]
MASQTPLISITVCVRDGVDWVDGCLEALKSQTYRPLEIIAIDDGSTDGSAECLQKWHDEDSEIPVYVLTQPPTGLSSGRQLALENAKGEWVAITDIDVRPEQTWIANLYSESNPVSTEETVVAVTGRTIFERSSDLISKVRSVEIASKYRSRPRSTSLANGPCSMFHRESLIEIGGFNPEWYHAEDMEVSLRLIENGGTIVYAPDALVSHVPESGRKRFLAKRSRDARAHVRIMRNFPRRRRKGPDLDFLGSSIIVLMVAPLWISALVSGLPFIYSLVTSDNLDWNTIKQWWEFKMLILTISLLILHQFILLRGPLGVVVRGSIREINQPKIIALFSLRALTLQWSLALWKGLLLGVIDSITGKNGHRRIFSK